MMMSEALLFPSLLLMIFGTGFFKTNTTTQVGMLYAPGDPRRDRAYSVFYVGTNLGAFLSPLIAGSLGEAYGWRYGFGVAGLGMVAALINYLYGWRSLPAEYHAEAHKQERAPLTGAEWKSVGALILLVVPVTLWWACYEQQGNTIALWADDFTDRAVALGFWQGEIPATWFQAFNPFMIFAFTPLVVGLWARQARRGREPSSIAKMALGCAGLALANLVLALAAWRIAGGGKASWLWLLSYFVILTLGELYLSPVGLSLVTKLAPARLLSTMMGFFLASSFIGNFLSGWLGSFWSGMTKPVFFLMIAAIAAVAGTAIWAMERPLRPILERR
jgi:proton-dependent oligopeptide transporter, POT family